MPHPPSLPPDHRSDKPDPAEAARLALRAVLTGVSIDVCVSSLLGVGIRVLYAMQVGTPDMTPEQLDDALQNTLPQFALSIRIVILQSLRSTRSGSSTSSQGQQSFQWR